MARQRKQQQPTSSLANLSQQQLALVSQFNTGLQDLTKSIQTTTQATVGLATGFTMTKVSLAGLIAAGYAGTTTGNQLAYSFKQLSMQVGALFLPIVEKTIDGIQRLTDWMRRLSGAQQESIVRWALFGVAMQQALGFLMKGNPFAAAIAGLVAILQLTDEGRQALADMGESMVSIFKDVATVLNATLMPYLVALSEFLSTATGQWLALGTVAVGVLYRIARAGQGSAQAFLGWTTAIGAAITLLGGLLTLLSKAQDTARQTVADIVAGVRTGRTSVDEARKQIREFALAESFKKVAKGLEDIKEGGPLAEEFERRLLDRAEAERERIEKLGDKLLKRAGLGRQDLTPGITGTEADPRQTIRRLEEAVLKTDLGREQLDVQKAILELMKKLAGWLPGGDNKDNRDQPPQED